ncbi:MAG: TonB-dependent receptor [Pseudomonadaceae bacterium]|nr:TonB-dependent receptor [Pseudomonadaceae bacterium]
MYGIHPLSTSNLRYSRASFTAAFAFAVLTGNPLSAADEAPSPGQALWEEVFVSAAFVPTPRGIAGSAVSTFDATDINNRGTVFASDLLREAPGLSINRSGPVGAVTQARIRGAEGNHTLVLIDGIEVNDPAFGSEFDFSSLTTGSLQRIEVLRGPQSALYGSDAIGGVISITTPRVSAAPRGNFVAEAGSFATLRLGSSIAIGDEEQGLRLSADHQKTDGVDASRVGSEDDGFEVLTLHGKGWAKLTEAVEAQLVIRYNDSSADADRQDFDFPSTQTQGLIVDANNGNDATRLYARLGFQAEQADGALTHNLAIDLTDTEADFITDGSVSGGNDGKRVKIGLDSTWRVAGERWNNFFTASLNHEQLDFTNRSASIADANYRADDEQSSVTLAWQALGSNASAGLSVRHDVNDRFDDATSARATASFRFDASRTRLHASIGQGVTNPSFFELFGFIPSSFIGNSRLKPETSLGWDIGVEQSLFAGRALLDVTLFSSRLNDEIATVFDFDPVLGFISRPENSTGASKRRGVEVALQAELSNTLALRGQYTYLDAKENDGQQELRRPRHTGSLSLSWRFAEDKGVVSLTQLVNGETKDSEFVFATAEDRVTLDSYNLLNIALRYQLTPKIAVFVRGENLLDEDIEEVFSYNAPGAAGYAGVRVDF